MFVDGIAEKYDRSCQGGNVNTGKNSQTVKKTETDKKDQLVCFDQF